MFFTNTPGSGCLTYQQTMPTEGNRPMLLHRAQGHNLKDKLSFEVLSRYTKALSIALHQRDPYTRLHCDRVDLIACEIGLACGLTKTGIVMLRISSVARHRKDWHPRPHSVKTRRS